MVLRSSRICMVESSDAGSVPETFLIIIWSLVLRSSRICMVESSDAFSPRNILNNHRVIGSKAKSFFAWLSHRMQVQSPKHF